MKRAYNFIYIVNIILGLVLAFSYLFIINYSITSIFIYIGICLTYILFSFKYFKKKKDIDTIDFVMLNIYLLFLMGIFVYNMIYQAKYEAYSLMYFNFYIYVIHIFYILYNACK